MFSSLESILSHDQQRWQLVTANIHASDNVVFSRRRTGVGRCGQHCRRKSRQWLHRHDLKIYQVFPFLFRVWRRWWKDSWCWQSTVFIELVANSLTTDWLKNLVDVKPIFVDIKKKWKCVNFKYYSSEELITLNTLHDVVPTWNHFTAESTEAMRIKSLAQGGNILMLGIEQSTLVSKIDILTTTPIHDYLYIHSVYFTLPWQRVSCRTKFALIIIIIM